MNELDRETQQLLRRFNKYLKGSDSGYFDSDEILIIARYLMATNNSADLDALVHLATTLHPNSDDTTKLIAMRYFFEGEMRKTIEHLAAVHNMDDESVLIYIGALIADNRTVEARAKAYEVIERDNLNEDLITEIAQSFMMANHARMSLEMLKKANQLYPDNSTLLFALAQIYKYMSKPKLSERTFEKIIELNPFEDTAWSALAELYWQTDKPEKAISAIDYALAVCPHDINYLQYKADILGQLGRFKESTQIYRDALQEGANPLDVYIGIGHNYLSAGQAKKALEWLNKADEKEPKSKRMLLYKFDTYIELENFGKAREVVDRLSRTDIPLNYIWERRGIIESLTHQYIAAQRSYNKALRQDPDNPYLLAKLSMVEWELGNYKKTKRLIHRAIEIDHSFLYGYMVFSAACFKLGQYDKMLTIVGNPIFKEDPNNKIFFELCPEMKPNFNKIINALQNKEDISHLLVYPDTAQSDTND